MPLPITCPCPIKVRLTEAEALSQYLADHEVPPGAKRFLTECFDKGWVKGGPRMYYVVFEQHNAPDVDGRPSRSQEDGPFWGNGEQRQKLTRDGFHACMLAGFLFILRGDAPKRSVMGTVMKDARRRGILNLGSQGSRTAMHRIPLSEEFVCGWNEGDLSKIPGGTLASNIFFLHTLNVRHCMEIF